MTDDRLFLFAATHICAGVPFFSLWLIRQLPGEGWRQPLRIYAAKLLLAALGFYYLMRTFDRLEMESAGWTDLMFDGVVLAGLGIGVWRGWRRGRG